MMLYLAVFKHNYIFLKVKRPALSAEDEKLLIGLKNRGEYHITIINKKEVADLPPNIFEVDQRYEITGEPIYRGLGRVIDGDNIVYFIVIDWPEAQKFRSNFGLAPVDLHITMGFTRSDIHGVRKNNILK